VSLSKAISVLLTSMPDLDASREERAAYFERKADVLDRIAAEGIGVDADNARTLASRARAEAGRIREAIDRAD
jgi:hypothetical protein